MAVAAATVLTISFAGAAGRCAGCKLACLTAGEFGAAVVRSATLADPDKRAASREAANLMAVAGVVVGLFVLDFAVRRCALV
jgi:hypothetical protein